MAVTTNPCPIMRRPVTSVSGQRVQPEQTSSVVVRSSTHKRPTHRDCPFNSAAIVDSEGEKSSVAAASSGEPESEFEPPMKI